MSTPKSYPYPYLSIVPPQVWEPPDPTRPDPALSLEVHDPDVEHPSGGRQLEALVPRLCGGSEVVRADQNIRLWVPDYEWGEGRSGMANTHIVLHEMQGRHSGMELSLHT